MRRFSSGWWLGMFLLFSVPSSGCQHNRPRSSGCAAPSTEATPASVAVPADAAPAVKAAPTVAHERTAPVANDPPPAPPSAKPSSSVPYKLPLPDAHSLPSSQNLPQAPQKVPTVATSLRFAHDANYRWLVGTLDYSRIQRGWLLRYAPIDEDDRYGGSVTLVAPDQAMNFKSGQTVRVEGALTDPESRQLRPGFRVQSIRVEEP